jgi:hypothetical protein
MASLRTPTGMLMFEHLFVAKPVVQGGEPRFNFVLLLDAEAQTTAEYKALRTACAAAIDAEFGTGKSRDKVFVGTLRSPFRDALEKQQYAGFTAGKIFIAPWTKSKPGLVDGNLQDITAASDVFAGQLCRATVTPFAYNQGANKGVNFMLNNVQIVKSDMPRMDGRKAASGDFERVDGAGAPAADDDSDAPF